MIEEVNAQYRTNGLDECEQNLEVIATFEQINKTCTSTMILRGN
jgi:hypothetical protein